MALLCRGSDVARGMVHGESIAIIADGEKASVRGGEEEPMLMRCAALHCPWGYPSLIGLGQQSELVPGSADTST